MGKGIFNIPASAGTGGGGGDYIRRLYMKQDQESAIFRFLSDADDIFFAQFHDINDPPFQELCVKAELGQVCRRCDQGDQPRMKFLAWVFEYTHDYVDKDDADRAVDDDYEVIKLRGGRKIYRAEINEVRLLTMSAAHKGAIQHAAEKHGTLLNHEYEMVRSGEAGYQRTTYLFEPSDEEEMSDELIGLAENLPDLEDVASGEVETLNPDDEEEEERPRRRKTKKDKPRKKSRSARRRAAEEESEEDEEEGGGERPLF